MSRRAATQLALLAICELLAMTLWFSATAVLPALREAWQLSASSAAWMTAAVQLGFVVGALGAAVFNLPDVVPPRRMFAVSALLGAALNAAFALVADGAASGIALRFATGVCLAGVYPPGMKIAAGHVTGKARGLAIGALVGALTLGSATPHLIAGALGTVTSYQPVMLAASAMAAIAGLAVVLLVRDGPHSPARAPFDPGQLGRVLRDRPLMLANLGYFGHMWELYAMWTWLVVFLTGAVHSVSGVRLAAFAIIGVAGCVGAIMGGWLADRVGRTTVTITAMAVSAACCLLSPALYHAQPWLLIAFGLVWGAAIVADSAQFSAAVTELAEPAYVGTGLTLQTSLGFALTLVPIWSLPELADIVGWQYVFVFLAPGPMLGCVAMALLRRHPSSSRLAAGKG